MRLLSHNVLKNVAKDVIGEGFPLQIEASNIQVKESDFNEDFIKNMLQTIDWNALKFAASNLGMDSLPNKEDVFVNNNNSNNNNIESSVLLNDINFLKAVHHILMDVHVIEGFLICPETGRRFRIENGIPNMLLEETELSDAR